MLAAMAVLAAASGLAAAAESPSPPPAPAPSAPGVVREYIDQQGRLCRVYRREIVIEGVRRPALATVCREPDGRWVLSR